MKLIFKPNPFDEIAFTENFLTDNTSTSHSQLPGYTFIHHNRIDEIGGGIGLYVQSEYQFTVLVASNTIFDNTPEYIITELRYKSHILLIFFNAYLQTPRSLHTRTLSELVKSHALSFE